MHTIRYPCQVPLRCIRSLTANNHDNYAHLQPVIESLPAELINSEHREAIQFIQSYSRVFSTGELDLGRTSLITHHIDMGNAEPIRQGLRRHPQTYLEIIDQEIAK